MLAKAPELPADEVFLDLEDSVAPLAKERARANVVAALKGSDWSSHTRAVRVNDATARWAYRDVIDVVEGAGDSLDCLVLPKVESVAHVQWLDLLLGQVEAAVGLPVGRIGIEAQIESARGLVAVDAIAGASPRLETIVFGPADFMASVNLPTLVVGEQPPGYDVGDAYHYVLFKLLVAARANDLQVIDGPYLAVHDLDGFRRVAGRSAALGFDGKWVLHPGQIEPANEIYAPSQADFERAETVLEAYAYWTSADGGMRGAAMLGSQMIDEASRKMSLVVSAKGRAAGLVRTSRFEPPA